MTESTSVLLDKVDSLAESMLQLLDDMGVNGTGVCLAAKAKARIAYEPFKEPGVEEFIMSLDEAKKIVAELE
jgi:hypothetical protein